MERVHGSKLRARFKAQVGLVRIICPDIPDKYEFMGADLVRVLMTKVPRYLPPRV